MKETTMMVHISKGVVPMSNDPVSQLRKRHVSQLAKIGERVDGRKPFEVRSFEARIGEIDTAEGVAELDLGKTKVMAGVKVNTGEPYDDNDEGGVLITNVELKPLASPDFENGPPRQESIEISRVIDRGIRESGAINFNELVVGEEVWIMFLDIHVLDYDGNVFDAGSIASLLALMNTKLPFIENKVGDKDMPLKLSKHPVSVTFVKVGESILADPNAEEERVADARLTVTTTEDGRICSVQKGLKGSFSFDEINRCVEKSLDIAGDIRENIRKL